MAATLDAHSSQRARFLPTTPLGRLAARLGVAFVAWFASNQAIVVSGGVTEGPLRLAVIAFGLAGLALGLVTGIVATLAIVRQRERAILAFVLTVPALMVLAFLLGELLLPH